LTLIRAYIERLIAAGELTRWTVAVRGRERRDPVLGSADWGLPTGTGNQISRSRLGDTDSVGVITSPGDEAIGFTPEQKSQRDELIESARLAGKRTSENVAARQIRSAVEGLLLLYPISRHSGRDL